MYLVVIAWIYVVVMMAVVEATSTQGTVLGAIVTFLLYGVAPVALVVYLMGSPVRRKDIRKREQAELAAYRAAAQSAATTAEPPADASVQPDAGGKAPADAITPVRKEP